MSFCAGFMSNASCAPCVCRRKASAGVKSAPCGPPLQAAGNHSTPSASRVRQFEPQSHREHREYTEETPRDSKVCFSPIVFLGVSSVSSVALWLILRSLTLPARQFTEFRLCVAGFPSTQDYARRSPPSRSARYKRTILSEFPSFLSLFFLARAPHWAYLGRFNIFCPDPPRRSVSKGDVIGTNRDRR